MELSGNAFIYLTINKNFLTVCKISLIFAELCFKIHVCSANIKDFIHNKGKLTFGEHASEIGHNINTIEDKCQFYIMKITL